MENAFNIIHSRCRVISENFHGRFKVCWNYWNTAWAMKLKDIGIAFRSMVITTNVIITIQDPLRRW